MLMYYVLGVVPDEQTQATILRNQYIQVRSQIIQDEVYLVPAAVYNAVVHDFATTRMIGRAVPCPGCDWDGCVDCNPNLEPDEPADRYSPGHPEWLSPVNLEAIHKAIDEIEARLGD